MKKCIYFADWHGAAPAGPRLRTGFRFDAEGRFLVPGGIDGGGVLVPGEIDGDGIVVDDREPPSGAGAAEAVRVLRTFRGPIVCDFERPPSPAAEALIRGLAGCDTAVPERYAHLPHGAVLIGPCRPGIGFRRWLDEKTARYGRVVLDGGEIGGRVTVPDARGAIRSAHSPQGDVPSAGNAADYPCAGAMCRYRREADAFVFFDTEETLRARAEAAGCPVILCRPG